MAFVLTSPAFHDGDPIPEQYVRDGSNHSPPLQWHGAPPDTRSFALVVEDPDAPNGTFRHWAIYDVPAKQMSLPENAGVAPKYHAAFNDFGAAQYDGPQPPAGHGAHHYHFRLAALDIDKLDVPEDARAADVWKAARDHILGEADLMGTFKR